MDRRSTQKLRLDRRLTSRRGWISDADLQRELEALPDVSDKIATADEDADPRAESDAPAEPPSPV